MQPLEMKTRAPLFIGLLILVVLAPRAQCDDEPCIRHLRTEIDGEVDLEDGSLRSIDDGALYPKGTFWRDGNVTWACPCLIGNCIRICTDSE